MHKVFHHLRNYLKERQEEKAYRQLLRKERSEWYIVESYQAECNVIYTAINPPKTVYKGDILVVCEENNLGERRVRTLNCPEGFSIKQLDNYSDILLWSNLSDIKLPPKPDRLYQSFGDFVVKLLS